MREDKDFLENLYSEKNLIMERRSKFILAKLAFVVGLFGVGTTNMRVDELYILVYMVPIVALIFDSFIYSEDYKIKRIGAFIVSERELVSHLEVKWEEFVNERRDIFVIHAPILLTIITTFASIGILWNNNENNLLFFSWILLIVLCITGLLIYVKKRRKNVRKIPKDHRQN